MLPGFEAPYKWAMSDDGKDLLGIAQRFGPYSFVVNTDKIRRATAEDQGWDLWNDPANAGRYGVLESDDWNVFDIFPIAGVNPFVEHSEEDFSKFDEAAKKVFKGAKVVGDIATMNQALVSGEIDFYMTGKGGVAWIEITSTVNNPQLSPLAPEFLKYLQSAEGAHTVAFAEGTFNPVTQMGDPKCFELFSKEELDAIQWHPHPRCARPPPSKGGGSSFEATDGVPFPLDGGRSGWG